nr:phosphoglycerate kinase, cytosolic-like isoform X1 [Tanacetum cinerariifolium]
CPNPDFNQLEHRWKRVQRLLIEAIEDMLSSCFFKLIEAVSLRMKQQSLKYGNGKFTTKKNDSWKTLLEFSEIGNKAF